MQKAHLNLKDKKKGKKPPHLGGNAPQFSLCFSFSLTVFAQLPSLYLQVHSHRHGGNSKMAG